MKEIAQKLVSVESKVAEEKGDLNLFALFLRESSPQTWDLLAAAPWIEGNKEGSLRYLAGVVQDALSPEELQNLSRIVLIDSDNPELDAFQRAFHEEHGMVEVKDSYLFGLQISHAYIITSRR